MILIVDSGSTKCDWISVNKKGEYLLGKMRTKGLNPAILSKTELSEIIISHVDLNKHKLDVKQIHFYGAGCGTEEPRLLLTQVLESIFINAEIEVKEDTFAAVRATLSTAKEAAVVCILGTGSNCSYYDGKVLHQRVNSLGYTIMDDASGNYYGRQLIRDYYFKRMPQTLRSAFADTYNLDTDIIKYNLYKQSNPNAYLAGFAEFMFAKKDSSDYIKELIKKGLRLFSETMILQFQDEIKTVPVHFSGSIAHFSKEEIIEVAQEFGYSVGNIIRRPIDGLVSYHTNRKE
ncbi:N-acetylglucosamine kinase [Bizionia argentinensis JUB59]|uniref:N-acetylglucosamine kinase n=1 Tax=Bizionia argentinensis JUB59 TaxID=1046627 RepID=G2E948_9FLAO|nr:N-acetylglucosamine kinase-like protein [Bizionia argentinensis]EGV44899.1 N-acetylglucosamine kinase [Bizionia argentinensis JUB59]